METPKNSEPAMDGLNPTMSVVNKSDREMRRVRILVLVLMVVEAISVFVPGVSKHWSGEFGYLPQILIGFAVLALIFTMHLASQRKLLHEVSTALVAASSYADRLEQISLIDPQTQLFNRRYLDDLFNRHLKSLHKGGSATLLLLEVTSNAEKTVEDEIVIEAAFILRSNFRGSDYLVRYSTNQFLAVLPDTNEQQAQLALSRLIDKVDHWNRTNQKGDMALRLVMGVAKPGSNLWDQLSEMEVRLQDKTHPGVRTFCPPRAAASDDDELRIQSQLVQ